MYGTTQIEIKRKLTLSCLILGWHEFEWSSGRFGLKLTSIWSLSYGDSTCEIACGFCVAIGMLRDDDDDTAWMKRVKREF
jgi:hypothetical protein